MNARRLKTAYELQEMIVRRARTLHGPWPSGMTLFVFDDAYGWISAAVGRRLTTPELLGKALASRSRMRWRGWVTAALQDAADGVHSPPVRPRVHRGRARSEAGK